MKILEKGTFGDSQCAHDLVDIMNSESGTKTSRIVGRILADYFSGVKDIMKTEHITETLLKMWVKKHIDRSNNSGVNKDIITRVNNLITARYRIELKKIKER